MQKLGNGCLAAAVLATLGACQPEEQQPADVNRSEAEPPAPAPLLPQVESRLDRAALLQAVRAAASATALGRDDAEAQRKLDGKKFEVHIRFGCASSVPTPGAAAVGPFNVRFDPEERTLRVRAAPDLTLGDPQVAQLAGQDIEAVEGFWMRRPWLLADGCPVEPSMPREAAQGDQLSTKGGDRAAAPEAAEAPPTGQRIGLAQFFATTDSRTGRRDHRAYEATSTLGVDEQPSPEGYNLVLAGRLRKLESGRVISCRLNGSDLPPDCVVSAEFDRVWIEHPQSKAIIAEWSS
jgi:hypothetical protein